MTVTPGWSVELVETRMKFHEARAPSARGRTEASVCSSAVFGEYGIAPSTSRWAGVASASIASAWPGCVAITTASYVDTSPLPSVISTPDGVSRTEVTLVLVLISLSSAATLATYACEPPVTVRHCGLPKMPSIPWCSRKVNR